MKNYVLYFLSILFFLFFSCKSYVSSQKAVVIANHLILPVLEHKEKNPVEEFIIRVNDEKKQATLSSVQIDLFGSLSLANIEKLSVWYASENNFHEASLFGQNLTPRSSVTIRGNKKLSSGENFFWVSVSLNENPDLTKKIGVRLQSVSINNKTIHAEKNSSEDQLNRLGTVLRKQGKDDVNSYRIPGLATTNKGTLIAVYDARYNSSVDLQADVDVGMSRSTDGGQTWEPMKIVMDMGKYNGLPESQNGIGDPAVLVDRKTGTIWIAALWLHGYPEERAWWASKQGLSPEKTGQFMLVKSEDDGKTWSEPINITAETKNPEWKLFFNGPGKGITMRNGTLVFPAQFKDSEGIPYSTIIYSNDHGKTWKTGVGAKAETTEAQVVELSNGSLMLNMRDDRNRANRKDSLNGRSVAVTNDMGKTWQEHPTSRNALIEPNCMASIIATDVKGLGKVLFFSNPASKTKRNHITIKTSFDNGLTWPEENQIELYENSTYGYSCLTRIDAEYLGILYEGNAELYFQKIPVNELISP